MFMGVLALSGTALANDCVGFAGGWIRPILQPKKWVSYCLGDIIENYEDEFITEDVNKTISPDNTFIGSKIKNGVATDYFVNEDIKISMHKGVIYKIEATYPFGNDKEKAEEWALDVNSVLRRLHPSIPNKKIEVGVKGQDEFEGIDFMTGKKIWGGGYFGYIIYLIPSMEAKAQAPKKAEDDCNINCLVSSNSIGDKCEASGKGEDECMDIVIKYQRDCIQKCD